ncbi:MAG TPA: hypothetical protein VJR29_04070 [bacterium]|nr:hypothetical protein [bacterium]
MSKPIRFSITANDTVHVWDRNEDDRFQAKQDAILDPQGQALTFKDARLKKLQREWEISSTQNSWGRAVDFLAEGKAAINDQSSVVDDEEGGCKGWRRTTRPLNREIHSHLREQTDFFKPVIKLCEQLGLQLKAKDAEAHVEIAIQEVEGSDGCVDGDIAITFVYPIDNDHDPDNGRLYLRDRFVFGRSKKDQLIEYSRGFDYKGDDRWKGWVKAYRAEAAPNFQQAKGFMERLLPVLMKMR